MKKLCALLITCIVIFAACPTDDDKGGNGSGNSGTKLTTTLQINNQSAKEIDQVVFQSVLFVKENADIIGTWTGNEITYGANDKLTLDIADNGWTAVIQDNFFGPFPGQGKWTRKGNSLTFSHNSGGLRGTGTLSENTLTVHFDVDSLSGSGFTFAATSSNLQKSIKSGNSITKTVEAGGGYIFFKVNSIEYYTNELVMVEENDKAVFTFTNNTLAVEVNNPGNTVTLGTL